ncbi:helix-turn-helix transcriptional regulator [Citrobacter rodentium]|nr:LuxR C-terminal-related transcriptional regulator [Citrobacter rodentium]UHO30504.1 LuxR C-terminal-related transcriptional regulator [Citrobacter rodentium NBRC 105723 = DSM 16636]HAT8012231.1 hypothetical protein [Citrobacter rodentium NBRC 105723 = DSM 16636]HAT8017282.1 hypothetical protein [Citrobacter rodentium]HAT8026985.1 hypothetical protein [Citrobacter rodentium]HAT8035373.1 hypothetical protein [Citrobacter rodentium]
MMKTILGPDKNIIVSGDYSISGVRRADIIIMSSTPALPCLCLPNFRFRQPHSLVIVFNDRHSNFRSHTCAACNSGVLLLNHKKPIGLIRTRLEQTIKAVSMEDISCTPGDYLSCRHCRLSKKQLQVIQYMRQGYNVQRIAKLMNVSAKTIHAHKYRIMQRIGTKGNVRLYNFINSIGQDESFADIGQIEKAVNASSV